MKDDLYSAICREALESRQRDVMCFVDNGMAGMWTCDRPAGPNLNGDPVPAPDDLAGISEDDCARPLRSGDFFSLGPSAVNLFLFFQK